MREEFKGMLKSTGIVRKVDELGRVVIPIELRRTLGIGEKDALEIYVDGDNIILRKYEPRMACMITGQINEDNLVLNDGKMVLSQDAIKDLLPLFEDYLNKQNS
jgi:AbrB family transcriptional regulator, transcriptional pleiotropic regulator of transition state genes